MCFYIVGLEDHKNVVFKYLDEASNFAKEKAKETGKEVSVVKKYENGKLFRKMIKPNGKINVTWYKVLQDPQKNHAL